MSDNYRVKLIDGVYAMLALEYAPETHAQALERMLRERDYLMPVHPEKVVLNCVWTFTIQIGATTILAGHAGGFVEKRHALKHAWKRLEDEGIMPGATLEREIASCACEGGPALVSGNYCGRCGKAPRSGEYR